MVEISMEIMASKYRFYDHFVHKKTEKQTIISNLNITTWFISNFNLIFAQYCSNLNSVGGAVPCCHWSNVT